MLIAPGRRSSAYSRSGRTSTSCAPASSSSRSCGWRICSTTGGFDVDAHLPERTLPRSARPIADAIQHVADFRAAFSPSFGEANAKRGSPPPSSGAARGNGDANTDRNAALHQAQALTPTEEIRLVLSWLSRCRPAHQKSLSVGRNSEPPRAGAGARPLHRQTPRHGVGKHAAPRLALCARSSTPASASRGGATASMRQRGPPVRRGDGCCRDRRVRSSVRRPRSRQ